MTFKITLEIARNNIEDKIERLKSSGERDFSFLDFIEDSWKGIDKTHVRIRCNKHNIITETTYRCFIQNKSWGCKQCCIEARQKGRCLCLTKEDAINKIQNKIKELNNKGFNLEFLGFVDDKFSTNSSETKLIIHCITHDKIGHPQLHVFLRKGYCCPNCIGQLGRDRWKLSNQEIYDKLVEKFGSDKYDFSSILNEKELGCRPERRIKFICKEHGEIEKNLRYLLTPKLKFPCGECSDAYYRKLEEEKALKRI